MNTKSIILHILTISLIQQLILTKSKKCKINGDKPGPVEFWCKLDKGEDNEGHCNICAVEDCAECLDGSEYC